MVSQVSLQSKQTRETSIEGMIIKVIRFLNSSSKKSLISKKCIVSYSVFYKKVEVERQ